MAASIHLSGHDAINRIPLEAIYRKEILRELQTIMRHCRPRPVTNRSVGLPGRSAWSRSSKPISYSQTWTFFEGEWHDGNVPIMGPRTHAAWLGSTVFDGARAFEGVAPDLDRHCARVNRSATNFGLKPVVDAETWLGLAREGIARFAPNAELYIRPMYWAQHGAGGGVLFDPETTNWCMSIYEAPMPKPSGNAITLSPFRRPTMECAPVDAKAACLYPNNSRALVEAASRGFNNCLMLDMLGNVAEFGNANVFMAQAMAWSIRRRRTAPSSTASPASASSRCCAAMA